MICDSSGVETHKLRTTVIKSLTKTEKIDTTNINMGILLSGKKNAKKIIQISGECCVLSTS